MALKFVAILGGGPAGLAAGYFARKGGLNFCVFEAQERVGGNAITHEVDGFRFDSGAHRFHDRDSEMTAVVRELLGADLLECRIPSQIYHEGSWVDFPLSPADLCRNLGWQASARAAVDFLWARVFRNGKVDNFESFAVGAY